MKQIRIKKIKDGNINSPAMEGDAGFDLFAQENVYLKIGERLKVPLGVALEIPVGYVGIIHQKSGLSDKWGFDTIGNVIDSSYRGEIHAIISNTTRNNIIIEKGDKIAQILFHRCYTPEIIFVKNLSRTERGAKGFGSTK